AKGIFTLGVGHVRRKTIEPGEKADEPAKMIGVEVVDLDEHQWNALLALKREFKPEEVRPNLWASRAKEAGVSLDEVYGVAESMSAPKITGNGYQIRKWHEVALGLALKSFIEKLRNGRDLNGADVDTAVAILLSPDVGDEVKADFLTALHRKGETTEEIAAFVQSLMKR